MSPCARSSSQTNREWRRIANKEDVRNALEELWDFNQDKNFHKIFSREYEKGIQGLLDLNKEDLKKNSPGEKKMVMSLISSYTKWIRSAF